MFEALNTSVGGFNQAAQRLAESAERIAANVQVGTPTDDPIRSQTVQPVSSQQGGVDNDVSNRVNVTVENIEVSDNSAAQATPQVDLAAEAVEQVVASNAARANLAVIDRVAELSEEAIATLARQPGSVVDISA